MHTFEDIIGYETQKQELRTICDILKYPEKYHAMGVRPPHAIMLYGDPGLGKTLMAKALIDESERKCFSCKKSKGKTDFNQDIKDTFDKAIAEAPSIVFLDDMDKFAEDNLRSDSNKEEFATIQACLEDVSDVDVFVIATANDIHNLPESLMRPGRFGRKMYVDLPSFDDFLLIAEHLLSGVKTKEKDLAQYITRLIGGRSPALLKEVVNEAGISAAFRSDESITKADITSAVLNVVFNMREQCYSDGPSEDADERKLVAYHEAGHAVVAMAMKRPLSIISIIGSGKTGGVCVTSEKRRKITTLRNTEEEIMINLGGRAAVETLLDEKENGVVQDFEEATNMLRKSCEKYLSYGFEFGYDLDDWDRRGSNNRKDDVCVKIYSLLGEYYKKVCRIIKENKELVKAISTELSKRTYLTYEDIDCIVQTI